MSVRLLTDMHMHQVSDKKTLFPGRFFIGLLQK